MIKAVVFDIGQTLVNYSKPLNWSQLYRPAFENIAEQCGYTFSENQYQHACSILTKYNTRIHPRDYEVSSNQIFTEIVSGMGIPVEELEQVKFHFYNPPFCFAKATNGVMKPLVSLASLVSIFFTS